MLLIFHLQKIVHLTTFTKINKLAGMPTALKHWMGK